MTWTSRRTATGGGVGRRDRRHARRPRHRRRRPQAGDATALKRSISGRRSRRTSSSHPTAVSVRQLVLHGRVEHLPLRSGDREIEALTNPRPVSSGRCRSTTAHCWCSAIPATGSSRGSSTRTTQGRQRRSRSSVSRSSKSTDSEAVGGRVAGGGAARVDRREQAPYAVARLGLESVYPVGRGLQGHGRRRRCTPASPIPCSLNRLSLNAAVSPVTRPADSERVHLRGDYGGSTGTRHAALNNADFYDLFGRRRPAAKAMISARPHEPADLRRAAPADAGCRGAVARAISTSCRSIRTSRRRRPPASLDATCRTRTCAIRSAASTTRQGRVVADRRGERVMARVSLGCTARSIFGLRAAAAPLVDLAPRGRRVFAAGPRRAVCQLLLRRLRQQLRGPSRREALSRVLTLPGVRDQRDRRPQFREVDGRVEPAAGALLSDVGTSRLLRDVGAAGGVRHGADDESRCAGGPAQGRATREHSSICGSPPCPPWTSRCRSAAAAVFEPGRDTRREIMASLTGAALRRAPCCSRSSVSSQWCCSSRCCWLLDSFKLVRVRRSAAAIGWGAAAALIAVPITHGVDAALHLSRSSLVRYVGPVIEETLKLLLIAFLLRRKRIGFPVDAACTGFAIGTGFALVENTVYLAALANSGLTLWFVRGLGTAILHGGTSSIAAMVAKMQMDGARSPAARRWPAEGSPPSCCTRPTITCCCPRSRRRCCSWWSFHC